MSFILLVLRREVCPRDTYLEIICVVILMSMAWLRLPMESLWSEKGRGFRSAMNLLLFSRTADYFMAMLKETYRGGSLGFKVSDK